MTDAFVNQTDAQLLAELSEEIQVLCCLKPDDQWRIVALARSLSERGMTLPFVLAGVRSSAEVLADLDHTEPDPVLQRPEVRQFLAENSARSKSGPTIVSRSTDVRRLERERLQQQTLAAIREARRSHGRHEIKKTRNRLMKIDQRELRRRLGREGDELCREINTILRTMAPLF